MRESAGASATWVAHIPAKVLFAIVGLASDGRKTPGAAAARLGMELATRVATCAPPFCRSTARTTRYGGHPRIELSEAWIYGLSAGATRTRARETNHGGHRV